MQKSHRYLLTAKLREEGDGLVLTQNLCSQDVAVSPDGELPSFAMDITSEGAYFPHTDVEREGWTG